MAMTSLLVRISLISGDMFFKSFPAINGAARIHHRLKCERYSVVVMPPLPTSSMSGSFQWPGPAYVSRPTCKSAICTKLRWPFLQSQQSEMSPVVRQRLPTSVAQSQGLLEPHSQRLKTMGRPADFKASRMVE